MNAYLTETSLSYAGPPPLLIAGSSDAALRRAAETARASGLRIGAQLSIEEAQQLLRQQPSMSAIWIEVDRDSGEALDILLDQVKLVASTKPDGF